MEREKPAAAGTQRMDFGGSGRGREKGGKAGWGMGREKGERAVWGTGMAASTAMGRMAAKRKVQNLNCWAQR